MSNVVKFRSADELCREYVETQRAKAMRARADRAALECLLKLRREFGIEQATGSYLRLAGMMLLEGAGKPMIRRCCRMLARCITKSMLRSWLTRGAMLH
jgi:hypothetical protein